VPVSASVIPDFNRKYLDHIEDLSSLFVAEVLP